MSSISSIIHFVDVVPNEKETFTFVNGTDDLGKPIRMVLEVEALGNIIVTDFGHSVLCHFIEKKYAKALDNLEDVAASCIPEGYLWRDFLKDEKFFLKLKTKNDSYTARIDPSMSPLAIDKSPISQHSLIEFESVPGVWLNSETKTAGLFLKISKITVDGGSRKKRRN